MQTTFLRRKAGGIVYTVGFSGDLENWAGGGTLMVTDVDTDWEMVIVRDTAPAESARRFVRVRVDLMP